MSLRIAIIFTWFDHRRLCRIKQRAYCLTLHNFDSTQAPVVRKAFSKFILLVTWLTKWAFNFNVAMNDARVLLTFHYFTWENVFQIYIAINPQMWIKEWYCAIIFTWFDHRRLCRIKQRAYCLTLHNFDSTQAPVVRCPILLFLNDVIGFH
jgi:hypothetical protein